MRLPDGWVIRRLDEIAEIGGGVTLGRDVNGTGTVELPYLRVANVQDGHIDLSEIKTVRVFKYEIPRYRLVPGDVLMTEGGDFDKLGRGAVWRGEIEPCLHQNHVFRVRADRKSILPDYLAAVSASEIGKRYFLQSSKQTTNLASINSTQLRAFPVPCPPPDEQRRIADILDAADAAIRQMEAVIAKLRQMKAGLLHDLLTRGLDEQGRLRDPAAHPEQFKDSPLGRIPKEWAITPVGVLFEIQLGKMLNKDAKLGKRPSPYLGNRHVQWDRVSTVDLEQMDFTTEERARFRLHPGDILVCEGGEVGRTAIWKGELAECYYQKAIHRLRPVDGRVKPAFFLAFMHYATRVGCLTHFVSQTSIAHLTREKFALLPMTLPFEEEQSKIIKVIESHDAAIRSEEAYRDKLRLQKRGLMHDLLTGRVRV